MTLTEGIQNIYEQIRAPTWAAPNLDGLTDVLRDLSWLPDGPVEVRVPPMNGPDTARVLVVLGRVVAETSKSIRPVRLVR